MDDGVSQKETYSPVLEAYRKIPGTMGLSAVRTASWPCNSTDAADKYPAIEPDSFAGLFPSRDRGSACFTGQPEYFHYLRHKLEQNAPR